MTKQEFAQRTGQLFRDFQGYAQSIPGAYEGLVLPSISTRTGTVIPLIASRRWARLVSECKEMNDELDTKSTALEAEQTRFNTLYADLLSLKEGFQQHYKTPNKQPGWSDYRRQLRDRLAQAGVPSRDADAFFDDMGKKGGLDAYRAYKKQLDQTGDLLNYAQERIIAHYMYNVEAMVVARYSIASSSNRPLSFNVSSRINALGNAIRSGQSRIHDLARQRNKSGLRAHAASFDSWLSGKIDGEIVSLLAYSYRKQSAPGADLQTNGRRAMKAGALLQDALYARALSRWIGWVCKWHDESGSASNLLERAKALPDSPIEWPGARTSISSIASDPQGHDNSDVIVEGKIGNLVNKHVSSTKVISSADLTDASGRKVKLVEAHIKLDSGGFVNGSYAEVSGRFLRNNPEAGGQPAISVDRLAMKDLGESNWNAWLRYQLRTVFEVPAHNLAIRFSLRPGFNGAINPVFYEVTYSEPNLPATGSA